MCEQSKYGKAVSTVLIENERTCVTEWRFKKYGDNTGWHRPAKTQSGRANTNNSLSSSRPPPATAMYCLSPT